MSGARCQRRMAVAAATATLLTAAIARPTSTAPLASPPMSAAAPRCAFSAAPTERDLGGGFRAFVAEEPSAGDLFADGLLETGAPWSSYTKWLNETIPRDFHGLDPFNQRACLEHQRSIFKQAGFPTHDWDVILNGSVGALSKANCLESLLWNLQNKNHPQKVSATEFGAFILLGPHNMTVKVYLQTGPTLSVPGMDWTSSLLDADVKKGYTVLSFLHLHPFDASNTKYQDCAGTCVPSGPDLSAFATYLKTYKTAQAWITNGADSFRFSLDDLGMFHGENDVEIFRGQAAPAVLEE